jgi:tetratricopeptide (TPR) repeat protein
MKLTPPSIPILRRGPLLALALAALAVAPAAAQEDDAPPVAESPSTALETPSATPRSTGRAVDRTGAPLEGVRVTLTPLAGGAVIGPLSTDGKGRWTTPPLSPGRYDVVLEKEGFLPSDGFVDVSPRRNDPIVVELRSLDEGTAAFAEADPQASVRDWIEKANALLAQGLPAEARAEYEKALRHARGEQRAGVLRAVARTHYLEGNVEATLDSLLEALRAWRGSEETLALYRTLMAQLGREDEAERRIADLDAEPPPADDRADGAWGEAASDETPITRRPPSQPQSTDAAAHRPGAQTVRFVERSPLATRARILGHYGIDDSEALDVAPDALAYDLGSESFDLIVPDSYRREEPWGLVVWISPTSRGADGVPAEVRELLERERWLWVGANGAGNPRAKWDRIGLALDAAHNVQGLYTIDPQRVVVAGYSGGGRTAMAAGMFFPEVFRGVVCWFGVDYFQPVRVPYKPGHSWPAAFPTPPRKTLSRIERELGFALVTGARDFNRSETASVFREMQGDGFGRVVYLEIPDADHYHGLDAVWLGQALDFVAPRTSPRPARPD